MADCMFRHYWPKCIQATPYGITRAALCAGWKKLPVAKQTVARNKTVTSLAWPMTVPWTQPTVAECALTSYNALLPAVYPTHATKLTGPWCNSDVAVGRLTPVDGRPGTHTEHVYHRLQQLSRHVACLVCRQLHRRAATLAYMHIGPYVRNKYDNKRQPQQNTTTNTAPV